MGVRIVHDARPRCVRRRLHTCCFARRFAQNGSSSVQDPRGDRSVVRGNPRPAQRIEAIEAPHSGKCDVVFESESLALE